jgi:hypothetical protein
MDSSLSFFSHQNIFWNRENLIEWIYIYMTCHNSSQIDAWIWFIRVTQMTLVSNKSIFLFVYIHASACFVVICCIVKTLAPSLIYRGKKKNQNYRQKNMSVPFTSDVWQLVRLVALAGTHLRKLVIIVLYCILLYLNVLKNVWETIFFFIHTHKKEKKIISGMTLCFKMIDICLLKKLFFSFFFGSFQKIFYCHKCNKK